MSFSVISGPKNLQVVKTSTTSVIVQWEEAQGEIDRYILSISPNQTDGSGKSSQEMKLPPGRDSAQIDGLEPGRLYDISLVAVKDDTQSLPANVQATPGEYQRGKLKHKSKVKHYSFLCNYTMLWCFRLFFSETASQSAIPGFQANLDFILLPQPAGHEVKYLKICY